MSKTFIKVDGELKEVNNVWTKMEGELKQKVVPKSLVNGNIKEFISYTTKLISIVSNRGVKLLNMDFDTEIASLDLEYIGLERGATLMDQENIYYFSTISQPRYMKLDLEMNVVLSYGSYYSPTFPEGRTRSVIGKEYIYYISGKNLYRIDKGDLSRTTIKTQSRNFTGVDLDKDGNIYTTDVGGYVGKFFKDGTTIWFNRRSGDNSSLNPIVVDDDVYYVQKFDTSYQMYGFNKNQERITLGRLGPYGASAITDGEYMYQIENGYNSNHTIRKIDIKTSGVMYTTVIEGSARVDNLIVDGSGCLYTFDLRNGCRKISENGEVLWFYDTGELWEESSSKGIHSSSIGRYGAFPENF